MTFEESGPEELQALLNVVDYMSPVTVLILISWTKGNDPYGSLSPREVAHAISRNPWKA